MCQLALCGDLSVFMKSQVPVFSPSVLLEEKKVPTVPREYSLESDGVNA